LESFQPVNTLVYAVSTAFFVSFRIQTYQCSRWRCLFARYFFFQICSLSTASTLPNFVCKQATIWKSTNIDTIFISWKDINPSMSWLMLWWLLSLFLAKTKPTNFVNEAAFLWDAFSFQFVSYQPLQRFQISCANKHNKHIGSMFIAWKVLKPFRDRKSWFMVLLGSFSAITHKPLKICRQVKHCKKGFCEIFQIGLTASYVCIWNIWENPHFCFVSCLFRKVLDDFQKKFLPPF